MCTATAAKKKRREKKQQRRWRHELRKMKTVRTVSERERYTHIWNPIIVDSGQWVLMKEKLFIKIIVEI